MQIAFLKGKVLYNNAFQVHNSDFVGDTLKIKVLFKICLMFYPFLEHFFISLSNLI